MTQLIKYHRTPHLPWSQGLTNDDRRIDSLEIFRGKEVVVTEKLDGENTSLYSNGMHHARSIDGRYHRSRDWVKGFWAARAYKLNPSLRVCGENMYAKHSIHYESLSSYFYGFSIWEGNQCFPWEQTVLLFDHLDIESVPIIWSGIFDEADLINLAENMDHSKQEGYVVRLADSYLMDDASQSIAKYVRRAHVQTDIHWMHGEVIQNGIKIT